MTFTATFFRRNPQSRNGGYNTTRTIEAKTIKEATKKAKCVIRTGEITPYANIILHSNVFF